MNEYARAAAALLDIPDVSLWLQSILPEDVVEYIVDCAVGAIMGAADRGEPEAIELIRQCREASATPAADALTPAPEPSTATII